MPERAGEGEPSLESLSRACDVKKGCQKKRKKSITKFNGYELIMSSKVSRVLVPFDSVELDF